MVYARLILLLFLSLASCIQHQGGHSHGGDDHAHGDTGHDHGDSVHDQDEFPSTQITLWEQGVEIFMEHELFEVNRPTRLITHITFLQGWTPKTEGNVEFRLHHPQEMSLSYEEEPKRDGIYIPSVSFPNQGSWEIEILVPTQHQAISIRIPVDVYGSQDEFPDQDEEDEDFISFLKEQQWKMDFKSEEVNELTFKEAIQVTGKISARPGGEVIILAPIDGRLLSQDASISIGSQVNLSKPICSVIPFLKDSDDPSSLFLEEQNARLRYDFTKAELEKMKSLVEQNAVPQKRLYEAEYEFEAAQARLKTAEARLAQYRKQNQKNAQIDKTGFEVYSPIAGTVVSGKIVPGTMVRAGDPLLHVMNLDQLMLEVLVPVERSKQLTDPSGGWFQAEGMQETVEISREDLLGEGGKIDPQTRTFSLYFAINQSANNRLKEGMFADVHLSSGDVKTGVVIHKNAVLNESGFSVVYVHKSGEGFERRIVRIGNRVKDQVHVLAGLSAGERVVTHGAYQVRLASTATSVPDHGHAH